MRAVVPLLIACACGGSKTPSGPTHAEGPAAQLIAAPASASDVEVATVNGRPVYASCVQTQAARGATKQVALEQCIDFELLAQAAAGYATDPEVTLQTRTALVSQVVAKEYEDKFTKPSDFGAYWDKILAKNRQLFDHGEARASAYVRIPVDRNAPPEVDEKAHAIANEVAAGLANERGMLPPHLQELADKIVAGRAKVDFQVVPPYLDNGGLVEQYAKPLFAIPEVGRTIPSAVRTPWGWDVILLTELIPASHPSGEALVEKVLPDVKRAYFPSWTTAVAQQLGLQIKLYEENLHFLEDGP